MTLRVRENMKPTHIERRAIACILTVALGACSPQTTEGDAADAVQSDAVVSDMGPALDGASNPDAGAQDASGTDGTGDVSWPDVNFPDSTWPDAGLPSPDWVPLIVGPAGSCTALTPCGGDVVAAWEVSGGCFEVDLESTLSQCPGAVVTRRVGRGRGRVVFGADGFGNRVGDAEAEVDFVIPELCARYFSCAMVQSATAALVTEATCTTAANGDCNCVARQITHIDQSDFYSIQGNDIVSTSSGKRWAYCASGDTLTYQDTSPSGPREPGIMQLRRR